MSVLSLEILAMKLMQEEFVILPKEDNKLKIGMCKDWGAAFKLMTLQQLQYNLH